MTNHKSRRVAWVLAVCWAVLAVIATIAVRDFGGAGLGDKAAIVAAAMTFGLACGGALVFLTRRFGRLPGALLGHAVFALPAIRLGSQAAVSILQEILKSNPNPALMWSVYAAVLVAVAFAVLCLGSAAGMAVEAAVRAALRPLWQRYRSRFGELPRPSWKAIRISVLTAALLVTVVYAARKGLIPLPEAEPPAVSEWIAGEKSLFRSVLAERHYDVLVIPVQTDGQSFDRVARSMMTRYLAARVADRTGAGLPDPTLVARALDVRARQIPLEDALGFAESVRVGTVLVSRVRRTGQAFNFRTQVWTREGGKGAWREGRSAVLEALHFEDRLPPSVAFRDAVDSLLDKLQLGDKPVATARAPELSHADHSIADLQELASLERPAAADRALDLQLFASLHARESIEAQMLWERSLVALWGAPRTSPLDRVLEARAYLHLARRPYALEKLGKPESAAERALVAVLNGNVPGVEAAIDSIENRALRLMTEFELADLYEAYGLNARLEARRKVILEAAWTEPAVLGLRLSAVDWFNPEVHEEVAAALSGEIPVALGVRDVAAAWLRRLYWISDPFSTSGLRLACAIERRYARIWKARAAEWAARAAKARLAQWDYFDLLFSANRAAAFKTVGSTLQKQALPDEASELIVALESTYLGHPYLTYLHAAALEALGLRSPRGEDPRLFSKSSALALSAYRWEGGESGVSSVAENLIFERPHEKYADEPTRWYRHEAPTDRLTVERTSFAQREMERSIADARRRVEYSDRDASPLQELVRWLRRAGHADEANAALGQNRGRFIGSVARADLVAEYRRGASATELYREILRLDPDSWDLYWRLGKAFSESGRPGEAQQLFLSYPGFARRDPNERVGLSNNAFDAGYHFYWRGDAALGEPLFEISSDLKTGSARYMQSRELLALQRNDMPEALRQAQLQVGRYNDSWAGMRYLMYLALLGRSAEAWSEFADLANRFGDADVWMAAFLAHRMQGLEGGGALLDWLADQHSRDTRRNYLSGALRERHAFMLLFIDRPPSDEALRTMQQVTAANNQAHYYVDLAQGYAAFRRGDFAGAAAKLRGIHDDLFNISMNRHHSVDDALPYLALAYVRSGRAADAEKVLEDHRTNLGGDSDYLVGRALIDGLSGRHKAAVESLKLAFHRLPAMQTRSFFPGYTLLEACEILLQESANDAYREIIEDFARRMQVAVPYPWAAAFEAKYARDLDDRQLALAAAVVLDPKSERIGAFPESARAAVSGAAIRHASALGAALRRPSR